MIIRRYLIREVFSTLLAVVAILMLIFMSNQFVKYLRWAAEGKYASMVIMRLMIAQIPLLLSLLLPLALYLAILLSYGRFYVENEMTIFSACGLSQGRVLRITMILALAVAMLVGSFMLWLNPTIMAYKERLLFNGNGGNVLQTIFPGRFEVADDGRTIYYVEKISRDRKQASDIFMATLPDKTSGGYNNKNPAGVSGTKGGHDKNYWSILSATRAKQHYDEQHKENFMVLQDGYRYFGTPGQKDFRTIQFKKYGIRLDEQEASLVREADSMSTGALLVAGWWRPAAAAELQWRIALPISALLLAILAVPLSRVRPRAGRYVQLVPAILVYVVYANLMFLGRAWIEQGRLSPALGLWWVHGLLLLVIIVVWGRQFGWRSFGFNKQVKPA